MRERRGPRIEAAGETLFTGEFWSGRQALDLGLIDGLGDVRTKMRELFGKKVRLKLISSGGGVFWRRAAAVMTSAAPGRDDRLTTPDGAAGDLAGEVISALEARALWARFGL